jgi:hypothetical protein
MDKYELRRLALKNLIDSLGRGGQAQVASKTGIAADYISRALYPDGKDGKKNIGEDLLEVFIEHYPEFFLKNHVSTHPKLSPLELDLLEDFNRITDEKTKIQVAGYIKGKADEQKLTHKSAGSKTTEGDTKKQA